MNPWSPTYRPKSNNICSGLAVQEMKWHAETRKKPFPHAHVATLTGMWRPLSCSQYGISASHVPKPCITSGRCSFLSDSGSGQILRKDFKSENPDFLDKASNWQRACVNSFFFLAQKWLILWFITAKAGQRNPKWLYLTRDLLFFCLDYT